MKYRFSVEIEFPHSSITQEDATRLTERALATGLEAFGHALGTTVHASVEKLRARAVDLDKPVGEQE